MKKKVPPTRVSKQTQTYPLRGDPVDILNRISSPEDASQQADSTAPETLLHSTSISSFKPRKSKLEDLQLSDSFLPPSITSMEKPHSGSKMIEASGSFVAWVPKPRQFTLTASTSYMGTNLKPVTSTYLKTNIEPQQKEMILLDSQKNFAPLGSVSSLDPSTSKQAATNATFSDLPRREPSPNIVATKSYQDSLNFFGTFALAAPSIASDPEPKASKKPLRTRFSQLPEQHEFPSDGSVSKESDKNAEPSHGRKYSEVGSQGGSTYSAVSSARRYSNPFMVPQKTRKLSIPVKARSVSQALSDMSGRSGPLKTRFAMPEPEDSVKAIPWCGKCKCIFRCCRDCSVYDPICNIPCCFPYIQIFWLCTLAFGFFAIWVTLFSVWGEAGWPGGELFEFYSLAITAYIAGWILAYINIPPSIGMFATGILFGNMHWLQTRTSIAATTRAVVVAFILLRAGLNTDPIIFKTRGGLISRMAFIPGIAEMLVATMFGVFMLHLPWFWALLFGCIIAALSPLAIIYSLVRLRENGYGEDKDITSVLLMMYAVDNITLITLFGIFFTLTFDVELSDGRAISLVLLQTLACICGGIGAGFLMGVFITFFPHRYDPYCGIWRTILLSSSGFGTILLTHILDRDGAGYLCTIVMAFTASTGWKALGTPNCTNPVNMVFAVGWHLLQPIALRLIGAEVNISNLEPHTVHSALIVVPCCMMTRFTLAFLMSGMAGFNYKERLFMALLSLTKGTPQAALAPMAMDLATDRNQSHYAKNLLDMCVLEVLITLPLGPLIATFMGPTLLNKSEPTDNASSSTFLQLRDSWDSEPPMRRQRCKSVVNRINTDNEFMLFTETGDDTDSLV